jgi:probable F420-dependent oxidoreductase
MTERTLRFGLQAFDATSAREWIDLAHRVEDLGFSTLFTCDHYFGPGAISDATGHRPVGLASIAALATAAAHTSQLRVGCRVFCCDFHHPIVLAKELATLDMLSEGRLEIGLGAGWIAAEYEGLGIAMDAPGVRISRLAEYVGALRAHFGGDEIDLSGEHVRVSGFVGTPLPVQRPHPPIMIGGGSPRILRLAGREADIVSFNYDNSSGRLGRDSFPSSTRDATERKLGWVREGAGDRFAEIELELALYLLEMTTEPAAATATLMDRTGLGETDLLTNPHVAIGSVDAVCEKILALREDLGISYVTVAHRHLEAFAPVVARLAGT